jgi:dipeptidyl-peptidase 4
MTTDQPTPTERFPRQHARTRRFTLGRPRAFTVHPDRVLFLRSAGGEVAVTDLWALDLADGRERRVVAAADLLGDAGGEDLPPEERARRERAREMASGITGYATDATGRVAAFALDGRLVTVDVDTGETSVEATVGAVFDPRPSPDASRVAYTSGGGLHVVERDGGSSRAVAVEEGVTWGLAEFVAAEELQRHRGYWWSPDGRRIAAARVDESGVQAWHIADPAEPSTPATLHRYPAAGTANADVRLAVFDLDEARRVDVRWDRDAFPYLAQVRWDEPGPLTLLVLSRDQRTWQVLAVDPDTGATELVRTDTDRAWLDVVPSACVWLDPERLAVVLDRHDLGDGGTRAVVVGDEALTPAGLQVRELVHADAERLVVAASEDDPAETHLYEVTLADRRVARLTDGRAVHAGAAGRAGLVVVSAPLEGDVHVEVRATGGARHAIASLDATPVITPRVELLELTERRLRAALLRPDTPGPWPVLLDPYGGPHAQRVVASRNAYLTSQWFADQGFAVLVIDGRGTPGRGPAFEREVLGDLATGVLDDQVAGLYAAAEHEPGLDLDRVAIRGWSFGGYLAALAVLRRPDVFRAAVAGAPVTDWRLYDTAYTERYLGHPDEQPDAYRVSSLVDADRVLLDPAEVGDQPPELLLIHGLADDNVVAAHSLRLSHALLAAGRAHTFLPLSGVTHMTPQEVVAERLLTEQAAFLHRALG